MKTIIITTKKADDYYSLIKDNWFQDGLLHSIRVGDYFNDVLYKQSPDNGYQACLLSPVDSMHNEQLRTDCVFRTILSFINDFNICRDDVFLFLHAGDFFPRGDNRRKNGTISHHELLWTEALANSIENAVANPIIGFRHDLGDVRDWLVDNWNDDISILCNELISIASR